MRKKYGLVINLPDNEYDAALIIESDEPFLTFQRGDIINPKSWNKNWSYMRDLYRDRFKNGVTLKVTGIEHLIEQNDDDSIIQHRIVVFTTGVEDLIESKIN